jgi:hypothetical protein
MSLSPTVFIWIERRTMNRLTTERRRGEGLSNTIIRLATAERSGSR